MKESLERIDARQRRSKSIVSGACHALIGLNIYFAPAPAADDASPDEAATGTINICRIGHQY
jgi:hypothetical protein